MQKTDLEQQQHPTSEAEKLKTWVTVTHLHSPLYGQRIFVIKVKLGIHMDLIAELPGGKRLTIDAYWTDFSQPSSSDSLVSHFFDIRVVEQFVDMVNRLKQLKTDTVQ